VILLWPLSPLSFTHTKMTIDVPPHACAVILSFDYPNSPLPGSKRLNLCSPLHKTLSKRLDFLVPEYARILLPEPSSLSTVWFLLFTATSVAVLLLVFALFPSGVLEAT